MRGRRDRRGDGRSRARPLIGNEIASIEGSQLAPLILYRVSIHLDCSGVPLYDKTIGVWNLAAL